MRRFLSPVLLPPVLLALASVLIVIGWWLPNRPQNPGGTSSTSKFNSLSYAAYRPGESPLTDRFATEAEADEDLALLAPITRGIRTYAAFEGPYDIAALAQKHGLKLWQGIWLGGDRAKNKLEMDRAIQLAHQYPGTIERLIVGNEVLLRRDLPPTELIADIDHVRSSVTQPVAYADVSDFWEQFPEIAPHVDVVMIHLLPYWEDTPTGIDHAVTYVGQVFRHFQALFPKSHITIGETGWPSRGRERRDAVPGRIAEARFLREFMALSRAAKFDYNFIEAFDQNWKYENEGIVGANWGLFHADRTLKIAPTGALEEDPQWRAHAAVSIFLGLLLSLSALSALPSSSSSQQLKLCMAGMSLGACLAMAEADVSPVLYDFHVRLAAVVNLSGQAILAFLMMMRLAGALRPEHSRTGANATARVQALLRFRLSCDPGLFEDLCFAFAWTAGVLQILLLFDPRYREFPLATFAVPLLVLVIRAATNDLPFSNGGREEGLLGGILVVTSVGSAIQEGALNHQSLIWNGAALALAIPLLIRFMSSPKLRLARPIFAAQPAPGS